MTLTVWGSNSDKTLEAQDNKVGFRLKGQITGSQRHERYRVEGSAVRLVGVLGSPENTG